MPNDLPSWPKLIIIISRQNSYTEGLHANRLTRMTPSWCILQGHDQGWPWKTKLPKDGESCKNVVIIRAKQHTSYWFHHHQHSTKEECQNKDATKQFNLPGLMKKEKNKGGSFLSAMKNVLVSVDFESLDKWSRDLSTYNYLCDML